MTNDAARNELPRGVVVQRAVSRLLTPPLPAHDPIGEQLHLFALAVKAALRSGDPTRVDELYGRFGGSDGFREFAVAMRAGLDQVLRRAA